MERDGKLRPPGSRAFERVQGADGPAGFLGATTPLLAIWLVWYSDRMGEGVHTTATSHGRSRGRYGDEEGCFRLTLRAKRPNCPQGAFLRGVPGGEVS